MSGRYRRLAELFAAVEAETPYGGRSVSHELLGSTWLKTGPVRRSTRTEAGAGRVVETMTAEARSDSRLIDGVIVRLDGVDWRIAAVEHVGGTAILNLERGR